MLNALKSAKRSIDLEMYAISDPEIQKALNEATVEKSVRIHDGSTKGLMHRKILWIDGEMQFVGSANMTTQSLTLHDNLVVGVYGSHNVEMWMLPQEGALERIVELLDNAHKSIRVAMFTLTNPVLVNALLRAHERGVDVSVAIDYFTAEGASKKALDALKGVQIYESQGLQLLHHKWAWIDESILIHGSANWTRAAFDKNEDCFMVLENLTPKQRRFMHRLWKRTILESR